MNQSFQRIEKKYLLKKDIYDTLLQKLNNKIKPDQFGLSTICNIYFDTSNFDLIRSSLDKPFYKEKIRLRSYGVPSLDSIVFLEIKKKFKSDVNKRRIGIKLKDFYSYLNNQSIIPDSQIKREIDYFFKFYQISPKLFIAYDRKAFVGSHNSSLRITFDTSIRSRMTDLKLESGDYGERLTNNEIYLMEIKINNAYPMWLVEILDSLNIYPTSFSKYGKIYEKLRKGELINV